MEASGGFREVVRTGNPDRETLVIRGTITRYEEGNAGLRLWIGFGAGSSYFDSIVELVDGGGGNVLGSWLVDKNSWGLGGMLASAQTPETFMTEAAQKVGKQISDAKKNGYFKVPGTK